MKIEDFILPFGGSLTQDNRWIKLSQLIPWEEIEKKYAKQFSRTGTPAKPLRMALGALIIKERCGFTDEETVEHIKENPYLQYFIGLREYQQEAPFDSSMMVWFRKRLDAQTINEINQLICETEKKKNNDDQNQPPGTGSNQTKFEVKAEATEKNGNHGTLILDATCAPSDIKYPTDLGLLNEAREKLEAMVDALHEPQIGRRKKPRTYRNKARKDYLAVAKQKQPNIKKIRKAIGKQLRYVRRDLAIIKAMIAEQGSKHKHLSPKQLRELPVIEQLCEQQERMYRNRKHRVENRIVSISQPYIRPIVRGKAKANTEFGAKVALRITDGYSFIEKLSWNNFNEGNTLIETVEEHKRKHGSYPEAIMADKLYRTRENFQYCKVHGIRLSGPKLGRPSKIEDKEQKRLEQQDAKKRNAVEGKFGEGKRRYGLDRIMAKLQNTSETVIALQFLVMNLERKFRILLSIFLKWLIGAFEPVLAR